MKKIGSTILKKGALYDLNGALVQLSGFDKTSKTRIIPGKKILTCELELLAANAFDHWSPVWYLTLEELQGSCFKRVPKNNMVLYIDRKYRSKKFTKLLKD